MKFIRTLSIASLVLVVALLILSIYELKKPSNCEKYLSYKFQNEEVREYFGGDYNPSPTERHLQALCTLENRSR